MKFKSLARIGAALLLSISSLLMVSLPKAGATGTTFTWCNTAGGNFSVDTNWSIDGNCSDAGTNSSAPSGSGDNLVFDDTSLTTDTTITDDVSGLSVANVTFSGSSTYGYTLTGSDTLTVTGTVTNSGTAWANFDLNVALGASATVSGSGPIQFGDSSTQIFNIGTFTLSDSASVVYLEATLSGSGTINSTAGGSSLELGSSDTSSFSGTITVSGTNSSLSVYSSSALPDSASVTMGANTQLYVNQDSAGTTTFNSAITLNGNGFTASNGQAAALQIQFQTGASNTVKFTNVTLGANSTYAGYGVPTDLTEVTASGGNSMTAIDGSQGQLQVNGQSVAANVLVTDVTSSNASNFNYGTDGSPAFVADNNNDTIQTTLAPAVFEVQDGGILELDDNSTTGDVVVDSGGTLKGSGTTANATIDNGGTVSPGHSPGCLTVANLTEGGTLQAELGGTTACTQYDQLIVSGTAKLDDGGSPAKQGTLNVSFVNGFTPSAGQSFEIINNKGSSAVTDAFANLPEGAQFTVSGVTLKITYKGGDGNDVVLSVVTAPKTPDTGLALVGAHPLDSLIATTTMAGGLYLTSRKFKLAPAKRRR